MSSQRLIKQFISQQARALQNRAPLVATSSWLTAVLHNQIPTAAPAAAAPAAGAAAAPAQPWAGQPHHVMANPWARHNFLICTKQMHCIVHTTYLRPRVAAPISLTSCPCSVKPCSERLSKLPGRLDQAPGMSCPAAAAVAVQLAAAAEPLAGCDASLLTLLSAAKSSAGPSSQAMHGEL